MVDYVQPIGGGYFYALPGVRNGSDWYASGLFA
jgi:deferrochelatase/peroxidase EfeB